jgi:hypothetical protein
MLPRSLLMKNVSTPRGKYSSFPDCDHARCECRGGDHQHESGRSNAFDIAYTQMRDSGAHKVEDEADGRRHTQQRPPDANDQT